MVAPDTSFLLIVAGLLLIYGEFIWVGKVWFGVAGAICALAGVAALHAPPTGLAIAAILGATVCFAAEACFETFFIAGVLGSVLWAAGFCILGVSPPVVVCGSALFGGVTSWLLSIAKRARRNKRVL